MNAMSSTSRVVFAIVVLAFLLRLAGIYDASLPFSFYPDEVNNVERSVNFYDPDTGFDLNPHWFNKPAFGYYLNFFFFGLYYLAGRFLTGEFQSPAEFATVFLNYERETFYVIGRLIQAVFGALTVAVVYRIGKAVHSRAAGCVAAAVLTVFPAHVAFSHVVKNDVSAAFFASLGCLACLKVLCRGRLKDYAWAGVWIGVGFSTKYVPLALVPALLAAHLLRSSEGLPARSGKQTIMFAVCLVLSAFVASPYNFLDPTYFNETFMPSLGRLSAAVFGAGEADEFSLGYLAWYALWTTGRPAVFSLPLTLMAVVGLFFGLKKTGLKKGFVLVCWLLVTYVLLVAANSQRLRANHVVAVAPVLSVLAALGILRLARLLAQQSGRNDARMAAVLLALLLMPWPYSPTHALVKHYSSLYTSQPEKDAYVWLQNNVPAGTTILNVGEIIPCVQSAERQTWISARIDFAISSAQRAIANAEAKRAGINGKEREQLERTVTHHQKALQWWQTQRKKLSLEQVAAQSFTGKRLDAIGLLAPWQSESSTTTEAAAWGYNVLWDRFPLPLVGRDRRMIEALVELPPVERYREAARLKRRNLPASQRTLLPVLDGRPVDYLIASEESYDNYVRPEDGVRDPQVSRKKRERFPEWAAFYDDLKDHYDYRVFEAQNGLGGWDLRLYDLRTRRRKGEARRLPR